MSAASTFAALGDATRLHVVSRLAREGPLSITSLSERVDITRQAVTKHLEVLAAAGVVRSEWKGRERVWELKTRQIEDARRTLDAISARWDRALERLRAMVEE
jgi:DNA-binding transcriptional ArsR family regulator